MAASPLMDSITLPSLSSYLTYSKGIKPLYNDIDLRHNIYTLYISFDEVMTKIWWAADGHPSLKTLLLFSFSVTKIFFTRMLLDNQHSSSSKVSLGAKIHNPTQAAERKLRNQRVNHPPVQGGRFKKMDNHASVPGCDLVC